MADLEAKHLSFAFNGTPVIHNIDFQIPQGEMLAIIGPNGSGKTTLLRLLSNSLPIQEGEVHLNARPIQEYSTLNLAKKIAFIASEQFFEFPFSVTEVVSMGRFPHLGRLQNLSDKDRELVSRSMDRTDVTHLMDRPIHHLSSGERQRVLLARALCQSTEIVMLDEPNAHLDIYHQIRIFELLQMLNEKEKLTVIVVLHDLTAAARYCQKLALLHQGNLLAYGTPKDVLTEENLETAYGTRVHVFPSPYGGYPQIAF